ncbi:MAG: hypothetical protein KF782_09300 [Labilithrix sp.]|nr:hypothetical protein [Labilithrix sp.]
MLRRWLALALAVFAFVLSPRGARADESTAHSVAVAVLALDSDDAEEQADALTGALRSRVRASQGWSLVETSQSLGMLTAALRCPMKPISAECEQRIADQIKSERYIFGYVTKGPQAGQVTAEVHLYQKSKPDTVIRESYADNLKDQNDDTLRKIAQRLLDRLGGNAVGTIVVRMGSENGEVVVDGDKRVPLQNGTARLELAPGGHSVEVAVAGQSPQKRNVLVTAGKETVVDLALATTGSTEPSKSDKPFPTRKVVGGGLMLVGVAGGAVALISALAYGDALEKGEAFQASTNPLDAKLPPGKTADEVCGKEGGLSSSEAICQANADANRTSTVAWVTGIGGGLFLLAGAYFLFTDGGADQEKAAAKKKTRLVPTVGQGSGGLVLSGSF